MFIQPNDSWYVVLLLFLFVFIGTMILLSMPANADPLPRDQAMRMAVQAYGMPYKIMAPRSNAVFYLWAHTGYARVILFTYNPKLDMWMYTHETILEKPATHIKTI